jgi:transposase
MIVLKVPFLAQAHNLQHGRDGAFARRRLGRFILATNEPDPAQLSPEGMLAQHKAQAVSVERGFRFLKDPLFFADNLFLKDPGRIMALLMIMVLALLVYSLAERKLRLQLAATGQRVLNQVGKGTQTRTLRWIFQVFEGIDLLLVRQNGQIVNRQVLNLKQEHLTVLRMLGPPVENCYNLSS